MKNEDDQVADVCFALKQSVDYGYQIETSLLFKIIQKWILPRIEEITRIGK